MEAIVSAYLVEGIQQIWDERRARGGRAKSLHQAELLQVTDVAVCGILAECEGVAPEVPLEGDDSHGHHANPQKRESGLSASKTRVQETQTRYHDQDHGGCNDDVGLVT